MLTPKRLFDILAGGAGFLLLSPVLAGVSACIRVIDGPPVFFRQQRMGRKGRPFRLIKFRTMAQSRKAEKGRFDAGDRSRITPLGQLLRRTKLDELPQLWNVLRGDMSLVGPRPEVAAWVAAYPERWRTVLQVQPGITDNASIKFRHEEDLLAGADDPQKFYREVILPGKLDLYEHYVHSHSIAGDLQIILETLKVLLIGVRKET